MASARNPRSEGSRPRGRDPLGLVAIVQSQVWSRRAGPSLVRITASARLPFFYNQGLAIRDVFEDIEAPAGPAYHRFLASFTGLTQHRDVARCRTRALPPRAGPTAAG